MAEPSVPYYRRDLARVHHLGFAAHAEACAPGILQLLEPIRRRNGLVLEIGCGSGLLTRALVDAGHRVVATDASPAMLDLAEQWASGAEEVRRLTLPDDELPPADAIVGVGHALNYLPDAEAIDRALMAIAGALRPGGVLALDLCDLAWGEARRDAPNLGLVDDEWAIVSRFSTPAPDRFVRDMTTFVVQEDGSWLRDDERHDNVLIETAAIPGLFAPLGVDVQVRSSFGGEHLPVGLRTLIGARRA
ncbi:MAG TPA: class I SAM-dependent methyltransferase [Acidimicrobiales bacterium]|jgi:SAM-dependent methyltransferase|nr:class I SAM-dependent methyltransferase [Acidimicrobiales bacterium]